MDNGKPIREILNVDIPLGISYFRYFSGCIIAEEGSANVFEEKYLSIILREPIGVVGKIVEIGLTVGKKAAKKIIPCTLELRGKQANIFFDDCDFDMFIDGDCMGILFNQG